MAKKKKCDDEIYYPEDILNEAYLFINSISADVAIYKNIRKKRRSFRKIYINQVYARKF